MEQLKIENSLRSSVCLWHPNICLLRTLCWLDAKRDRAPFVDAVEKVTEWRELVLAGTEQVIASPAARQLVEERERRLKTSQSRYANHAVRDRWTGASGADRLTFRWAQAKSHLRDLAHAE